MKINKFGTPIIPAAFPSEELVEIENRLNEDFRDYDDFIVNYSVNENGLFIVLYFSKKQKTLSIELTASNLNLPISTGVNKYINIDLILYNITIWNKEDCCSEKHLNILDKNNAISIFFDFIYKEITNFIQQELIIEEY